MYSTLETTWRWLIKMRQNKTLLHFKATKSNINFSFTVVRLQSKLEWDKAYFRVNDVWVLLFLNSGLKLQLIVTGFVIVVCLFRYNSRRFSGRSSFDASAVVLSLSAGDGTGASCSCKWKKWSGPQYCRTNAAGRRYAATVPVRWAK